jgi:hypothetical protein
MDPQYWFTLQQIAWMNMSTEVTSDIPGFRSRIPVRIKRTESGSTTPLIN